MKTVAIALAVSIASLATVLGGCAKTDSKSSIASLPSASAMTNDLYMQQPRGSNNRPTGK